MQNTLAVLRRRVERVAWLISSSSRRGDTASNSEKISFFFDTVSDLTSPGIKSIEVVSTTLNGRQTMTKQLTTNSNG